MHKVALPDLNLAPNTLAAVGDALARESGLVLITGTTGSGKGTTAQVLLRCIEKGRQVVSLSSSSVDGTAKNSLPAVEAGELRNPKEVVRACELAAKTLVLGILRSGFSRLARERLIDMDVAPEMIARADLVTITLQLCRRLCKECRRPRKPLPEELARIDRQPADLALTQGYVYEAHGCVACGDGYAGKVPLVEVLAPDLTCHAVLADDGLAKLLTGETTLEELERVLPGPWGPGR